MQTTGLSILSRERTSKSSRNTFGGEVLLDVRMRGQGLVDDCHRLQCLERTDPFTVDLYFAGNCLQSLQPCLNLFYCVGVPSMLDSGLNKCFVILPVDEIRKAFFTKWIGRNRRGPTATKFLKMLLIG